MAKEEWGTKQTCPKCSVRFYDLRKSKPVTCIECGHSWIPEPVLKTKQPILIDDDEDDENEDEKSDTSKDGDDKAAEATGAKKSEGDSDGDQMIADVSLDDADDEEVSSMVDTKLESGGE